MDIFDSAATGALPVAEALREQLLEPFIAATTVALGEMAGTEVAVRATYRTTSRTALGGISVVVKLVSDVAGPLVLSFPERTARSLASRILAGATAQLDENLMRDCIGEIGNVVAGQAKALLAGTPYHLGFSLPETRVGAHAFHFEDEVDCLVVVFTSDQGEFALQLFVKS